MPERGRYPFLSWKGRAALLVLDALGTTGTALHELLHRGPPRPFSPPAVGEVRSDPWDGRHMVEHRLDLARAGGAVADTRQTARVVPAEDQDEADRWLRRMAIEDGAMLTALAPGAGGSPHKRWPPSHFARLGQALAGEFGATVTVRGRCDRCRDVVCMERISPQAVLEACRRLLATRGNRRGGMLDVVLPEAPANAAAPGSARVAGKECA